MICLLACLLLLPASAVGMKIQSSTESIFSQTKHLRQRYLDELSAEERNSLAPSNYKKNNEQGKIVFEKVAQKVIDQFVEKPNENSVSGYVQYMIALQDASVGLRLISVVDKLSAFAVALGSLSDEERFTLEKENYCNKFKVQETLNKLYSKKFELLQKHKLINLETNKEKYINNAVNARMKMLDNRYK